MVEKVNGRSFPGNMLGGRPNYITLTTGVDIRPSDAAGGSSASQARLDKVIEVISLRGQPVLFGGVTGSGPYVMRFAVEHFGAWAVPAAMDDLVESLVAHAPGMGFTGGNTSVASADLL